jgi:hypothetical protein
MPSAGSAVLLLPGTDGGGDGEGSITLFVMLAAGGPVDLLPVVGRDWLMFFSEGQRVLGPGFTALAGGCPHAPKRLRFSRKLHGSLSAMRLSLHPSGVTAECHCTNWFPGPHGCPLYSRLEYGLPLHKAGTLRLIARETVHVADAFPASVANAVRQGMLLLLVLTGCICTGQIDKGRALAAYLGAAVDEPNRLTFHEAGLALFIISIHGEPFTVHKAPVFLLTA